MTANMRKARMITNQLIADFHRNDFVSFTTPEGGVVVIDALMLGVCYKVKINGDICGLWDFNACCKFIKREVKSWF